MKTRASHYAATKKVTVIIAVICAASLGLVSCSGQSGTGTQGSSGSEAATNNGSQPNTADASTSPTSTSSPASSPASGVVATVYGQATPPNAPKETMSLYSVEVPSGAKIAPHQHPGLQLSRIMSGELTYTVDKGTLTVFGAPTTPGQPVSSRTVPAGTTLKLAAGTTVAEPKGMIHHAENAGGESVKIDISILVPQGDPFSIPAK